MRIRSSDDDNDDIMGLSDLLDNTDFSTELLLENDMVAVKKPAAAAKTAVAPKTKATTVKAAKPAAAEGKAKGVFGPRVVPEGYTGLNTLAEQAGITPAAARRKLRGMEGMTKPEGQHGWYWKDGSKDLEKVKKALAPAKEA